MPAWMRGAGAEGILRHEVDEGLKQLLLEVHHVARRSSTAGVSHAGQRVACAVTPSSRQTHVRHHAVMGDMPPSVPKKERGRETKQKRKETKEQAAMT